MNARMSSWLAAALLGIATSAPAQDPAPFRLTLGAALEQALTQNPTLQRQLLEQVRKEAEVQEAKGALIPSLEARVSETRHSYNYESFLGSPAGPGTPVVIGPFSLRSVGAYLQAPLLDLGLWRRWRGSRSAADAAKAEVERTREEISALVVGQYLLALRAEAQVRAVQARIELAKALEELAIHQEQSGVGTGIDTLRAKVRTQSEEQALIQARTSRQEALNGLVRLLDLPGTSVLEIQPLAPREPDPAPALASALDEARQLRPDFQVLKAQTLAADERVMQARAGHLPSVQAFAYVERAGLVQTNLEKVFEVGVQVKVPLFMGGRVMAQTSQAQAARSQLEASRRELEAKVAFELRTAGERLEAARSELAVTGKVLGLAREELEQARHRFEAGVSNNIELVNAQEELARAEEGNLDARYRLDQAEADLAHARGDLESRYAR